MVRQDPVSAQYLTKFLDCLLGEKSGFQLNSPKLYSLYTFISTQQNISFLYVIGNI
jgi:hypothetical protein